MNAPAAGLAFLLAAAAAAQDPDAPDRDARCRALAVAQDRGQLSVDMVVAALADDDEEVARTAAAIVRHEWFELPPALFAALDARPLAATRLLQELALAPRPAAAEWAAQRSAAIPGRTPDERCLALAARGGAWTDADVDLVRTAMLAGDGGDGLRDALQVMPAAAADRGLGRLFAALHAAPLAEGALLPWLERTSERGLAGVLAQATTAPHAVAQALLAHVHERQPASVLAEAAANLDAEGALAARWLPFVAPLLDRPARIAKVDGMLVDPARPPDEQRLARDALLAARVVTDRLLVEAEAADADGDLLRARLLDVAIDDLPAATLLAWLRDDRATATVTALVRRQALEPELERELLRQLREAGTVDGVFCAPAALAIVQHGAVAAVQEVWPLVRHSPAFAEFVDAMARRPAPFVHELLLTELATTVDDLAPEVRVDQLEAVALALAARGDRRELQRLVAAACTAPPEFVRRCAHWVRPLPVESALLVLAAMPDAPPGTAAEMLGWAATAVADERVPAALQTLWRAPSEAAVADELRELALHPLAASRERAAMVGELRAALAAGPLPDALEPLPYALLGSMPSPPAAADLALAAAIVLLQPCTDPEREAALAARWPDGDRGFPLAAAVAGALGSAEPDAVAAAFADAVATALADPRHVAIARGRLLVLWRGLQRFPAVQQAVGRATAPLLLALPGDAGNGAAHWFSMQAAAAAGEHAAARSHAIAAGRELVRLPARRRDARWLLGERDPGAGVDPHAALAAAPHGFARLAALARGDAAAAAEAARRVREFAGHDRATSATLLPTVSEPPR